MRNPRGFFVIVPVAVGLVLVPLLLALVLPVQVPRPDAPSLPCVSASVVVDQFTSAFMFICPECTLKFALEASVVVVAVVCNHVGEVALRIAYSIAGETGVNVLKFEGLSLPPASGDGVEASVLVLG